MRILKINFIQSTLLLTLLVIVLGSCKHDPIIPDPIPPVPFCEQANPTYIDTMMTIINLNCSYAGCHASGAGIGDFTTYSGMLSRLDNGKIKERVIDMKDDASVGMPPNYATGGPIDLTNEQLELFMCWLDNDYPEQ